MSYPEFGREDTWIVNVTVQGDDKLAPVESVTLDKDIVALSPFVEFDGGVHTADSFEEEGDIVPTLEDQVAFV